MAIDRERIDLQGGKALCGDPHGAGQVAVKVVGYDEESGDALVKFACSFKPKRVPLERLFAFPVPVDFDELEADEEERADICVDETGEADDS